MIPIVTSRITNPTVPAVPGSIRRRNVGPTARPMSRAIVQPSDEQRQRPCEVDPCVPRRRLGDRSAVRASSSVAEDLRLVVVDEQDADQQRHQHDQLTLRAADRALADVDRQTDALPRLAAGLEHPLQVEILA